MYFRSSLALLAALVGLGLGVMNANGKSTLGSIFEKARKEMAATTDLLKKSAGAKTLRKTVKLQDIHPRYLSAGNCITGGSSCDFTETLIPVEEVGMKLQCKNLANNDFEPKGLWVNSTFDGSHERVFFSLDFNYHGDRDDLFVAVKFFDKESGFKYRLGSEQQYGGRKMMHFNTMKDAAGVQSISAGATFPTGMSTGDFTGFRMKLKSGPTGTGSAKNISHVEMHELAACAVFITGDEGPGDDGSHCFGATCASGDWVPSNYFSAGEKFVEATDGADCINQCGQMGYTSANMPVSCSGDMECYCQYAPSYDALKNQEDATSD